jgi:multiple sugar transport system substrate-binding protein
MFFRKIAAATALTALMGTTALAVDCGPSGNSVRILGSDFPAIQAVAGTAEANCAGNAGEFTVILFAL